MSELELKEKLSEINGLVEPVINQLLVENTDILSNELALYQCKSGGKRVRPALLITSGRVFGCKNEDLLRPAAAIEILHNATLIVDDIIDHSEFRRNEPTCWYEFGTSMAECSSFIYLASTFSGLRGSKNEAKLLDVYGKTLKVIIDGEIKDILFERSGREDEKYIQKHRYVNISKDDYFQMIGQKTAVLLQASCKSGAICADASDEQVEALGDFGYDLGMIFQIRDDVLDIFGNEKEFGKKIGKDIIEKKMGNFIILTAMEQLGADDLATIKSTLGKSEEITDEDIVTVTALIEKTNAKDDAEATINDFLDKAFSALDKIPQNEHTDMLRTIANYVAVREK